MYTIKRLKADELPLLTQLFTYKDIDNMLKENSENIKNGIIDIFCIFEDVKLVGELRAKYVCHDDTFAQRGKRAYLYAFRINDTYQGKGIGSYLLENVIDILKKEGYSEFTIGVEDDNVRARNMYKKYGFTIPLARIKETYQNDSYEYNLLLKTLVK